MGHESTTAASNDYLQIVGMRPERDSIEYLFDEGTYIQEAWNHIDGTYSGHYGGEIQPTEVIIDAGHGTGFNIGNIIKYAKRYGRKEGYNRKDLLKIIHYATMQLYVHDKEGLGATNAS